MEFYVEFISVKHNDDDEKDSGHRIVIDITPTGDEKDKFEDFLLNVKK